MITEFKPMTSITYISMLICALTALISQMQRRRRRHLPPIDFAVAIAPLVKMKTSYPMITQISPFRTTDVVWLICEMMERAQEL